MDALLAVVIGSAPVGAALLSFGRHQLRARAWHEAACALGFTGVRRTDGVFSGSLTGTVEGLRVEEDSPAVRSAARQAIAEIQSRLSGAGPGQLSLAGGEAGQHSLSENEAGRRSLAPSLAPSAPPSKETA